MTDLDHTLHKIQVELKAPKNQFNAFGNYKYRSCEDIVEAVKPLLPSGVSLVLSDEIVQVGDRIYVKAEARLKAKDESVSAFGWAREPLSKKGMDESQITGAASSYARKYALNGLFAIDDTKDADTEDNRPAPKPVVNKQPAKNSLNEFDPSEYVMPFGKQKGTPLGKLSKKEVEGSLIFWRNSINDPKYEKVKAKAQEAMAAMEMYLQDIG